MPLQVVHIHIVILSLLWFAFVRFLLFLRCEELLSLLHWAHSFQLSDPSQHVNKSSSIFLQVPAAAFLVIIERNLQIEDQEVTTRKGHVNMVFYLFWLHVYQLLTVLCFFWTDFVPGFGYTDNIYHFGEKYVFLIQLYTKCNYNTCICHIRTILIG